MSNFLVMITRRGIVMIITEERDILTIDRGILVHGCNAQGVMGAGLAFKLKEKYPTMYYIYSDYCLRIPIVDRSKLLGKVVWFRDKKLLIANAITQLYYGRNKNTTYVDYLSIEKCFKEINKVALVTKDPVYFPKIGAGLGNGDWNTIAEIIDKTLDDRLQKVLCLI